MRITIDLRFVCLDPLTYHWLSQEHQHCKQKANKQECKHSLEWHKLLIITHPYARYFLELVLHLLQSTVYTHEYIWVEENKGIAVVLIIFDDVANTYCVT